MPWEVEYTDEFGGWWDTLSTPKQEEAAFVYRVLCAFDPRRTAILLIGGDKAGNDRWYDKYMPLADRLYDEHLAEIADDAEKWRMTAWPGSFETCTTRCPRMLGTASRSA